MALAALKRKKRFENQLKQIDGTLTTIEFQREALENANTNTSVLQVMGDAAKALKRAHADMYVGNLALVALGESSILSLYKNAKYESMLFIVFLLRPFPLKLQFLHLRTVASLLLLLPQIKIDYENGEDKLNFPN